MWETKILGVDLYHVLAWFWLYSFCGWIWESSYVSIRQKKLVNRGFVNGPLLTLYGTGAVMVYLILRPFEANVWALYFGGVIVATVLEYVTGVLMESHFSCALVGLSAIRSLSFRVKICLSSSIAWGFFTLGAVLYSAADCRESSESCFGYYRRDHCFRCYRLLSGRFWIFRSRSIPAGTEDAQSGENVGRIYEISAEIPL